MATLDEVTGILDRSSLNEDLKSAFAKAVRENEPLGLVFVDIDRFKKINDTHGHQKGDAVLNGVAQRLRKIVEGKGAAYRYGGEEMVVLLPNHEITEAASVAERCRRTLGASPVAGVEVTASFGVSEYPASANSVGELIDTADKAMYDAKNRGRNLVRLHGELEPSIAEASHSPRRQPEPDHLADEQKEKIRGDYFRFGRATCPKDQAIFEVLKRHPVGEPTPQLLITCPLCGLHEVI